MESLKRPPEIEDLSDEIKEVCALKESAISDQNFEEAAEARGVDEVVRDCGGDANVLNLVRRPRGDVHCLTPAQHTLVVRHVAQQREGLVVRREERRPKLAVVLTLVPARSA